MGPGDELLKAHRMTAFCDFCRSWSRNQAEERARRCLRNYEDL